MSALGGKPDITGLVAGVGQVAFDPSGSHLLFDHLVGDRPPRPRSCVTLLLSERRCLLCVTGEDKVARFDLIVAGKAGFHERLVARRFAVLEVSETPTARCGVFFCVLDHKLNVRWVAGYERLVLAKDFVVFLRRHVTVMQSGNDRAVRERDLPFAVGLNRQIVAQNGREAVEVAFLVGHGDQPPVAVSRGNAGNEDRGALLISCGWREGDNPGQRCNSNQWECDQSHLVSPLTGYHFELSSRTPEPSESMAARVPRELAPGPAPAHPDWPACLSTTLDSGVGSLLLRARSAGSAR